MPPLAHCSLHADTTNSDTVKLRVALRLTMHVAGVNESPVAVLAVRLRRVHRLHEIILIRVHSDDLGRSALVRVSGARIPARRGATDAVGSAILVRVAGGQLAGADAPLVEGKQ